MKKLSSEEMRQVYAGETLYCDICGKKFKDKYFLWWKVRSAYYSLSSHLLASHGGLANGNNWRWSRG